MKIKPLQLITLLACGVMGALACRGITEEGQGPQEITLDLRSLMSGAPPDFVSVLDTARLRVAVEGIETSQVLPLGQSDSTVTFEVTVRSGSVRFRLDVFSNNLTPLYLADTTVNVDADNFAVQITPRAVNGVPVIWPRNPPHQTIILSRRILTVARWQIRNAGLTPIEWNVDSAASDGAVGCLVSGQLNCFAPLTLAPDLPLPDTALLFFEPIEPGTDRTITFTTTVGQASFATGIP